MNLCDPEALRALLEEHGFRFTKSMGQNFLIDPEIPRAIAEASGAHSGCGVLEIGPGVGCLTAELAQRAGKVVAVELDRDLLPVLRETVGEFSNVEILQGDALRLDLAALAREKFAGLTPLVCANLPYNITTPLLTRVLDTPAFQGFTVLLQREAARRLCAASGDFESDAFSLLLHYRMETELLFDVPPQSFLPAPKVTSAVLRAVRRSAPAVAVEDEALFRRVLRGAFLLRRKTLVNSLAAAFPGLSRKALADAVEACGLRETVRGEQLSLQDFANLAAELSKSWQTD